MTERQGAGQDGEGRRSSPNAPDTDQTVVQFPDRMRRRQARHPVRTNDVDGPDPGPSAA